MRVSLIYYQIGRLICRNLVKYELGHNKNGQEYEVEIKEILLVHTDTVQIELSATFIVTLNFEINLDFITHFITKNVYMTDKYMPSCMLFVDPF